MDLLVEGLDLASLFDELDAPGVALPVLAVPTVNAHTWKTQYTQTAESASSLLGFNAVELRPHLWSIPPCYRKPARLHSQME